MSVISAKKPYQSSGHKVFWKREDHVSGEREERPPPYNPDNLPVCYSCGKEGHISRECTFSLEKTGPKMYLHQLQAKVDRLSKENEERVLIWRSRILTASLIQHRDLKPP